VIKAYGCSSEDYDVEFKSEHTFVGQKGTPQHVKFIKYEFNLATGKATSTVMSDAHGYEFPCFNLDYAGYKSKYTYLATYMETMPGTQKEMENSHFTGFIKFDIEQEKQLARIKLGENEVCGEVFYQPRDGATEEDDGYLMTFVFNWATQKSQYVMWDAKTLTDESKPVLKVQLNHRIPNGFHSYFIQEDDLE